MGQGPAWSYVPYPTPAAIGISSGADLPLPLFLHLQASEPEQTTSDPVRAAAAPVWNLICSIFEPVRQKTAKHAQPSPAPRYKPTPSRGHSWARPHPRTPHTMLCGRTSTPRLCR